MPVIAFCSRMGCKFETALDEERGEVPPKRCPLCGDEVIDRCPFCQSSILVHYHSDSPTCFLCRVDVRQMYEARRARADYRVKAHLEGG